MKAYCDVIVIVISYCDIVIKGLFSNTIRVHSRGRSSNSRTFKKGFLWQSSRTFSRTFFVPISDNLDAFMGSESRNTKG